MKVIDGIKNRNEQLFLKQSKMHDYDVELKQLEGESSSKIKRDLTEAKRKIERKYSPARVKQIGIHKLNNETKNLI